jgi:GT2 family glycosyltransferase
MEPPARPDPKALATSRSSARLAAFLDGGQELWFPEAEDPVVSIVIVLYNRAELTFGCLVSLTSVTAPIELVVVDNGSSDRTAELLERVRGLRVIRNPSNRGFLRAVNQAARRCRGRHLLLLNNDAELLPGALEAALETLESDPAVGAVGGRLVLPDGRLQEAGGIVWNDGSCVGYGRGEAPDRPEFMYRRDVDYCSGAFLLTPRALFERLGGFDDAFAPAYYEDVDYCLRLWARGHRVVYEPRATIEHHEFASSPSMANAIAMQAERRATLVARHGPELARHRAPAAKNVLLARERRRGGCRLLVLDDRVPHERLGAGLPRARRMLAALVAQGHQVTFVPLSAGEETWADAYSDLPREIEIFRDLEPERLAEWLVTRAGHYDIVLVSRPHNLLRLRAALASASGALAEAALVYDAEAVFASREVARRRLGGEDVGQAEEAALVHGEASLAANADLVLAVSEAERGPFVAAGCRDVRVLGHGVEARPGPTPFANRHGLLFAGAAILDADPNTDALAWLAGAILPALAARVGTPLRLRAAGLVSAPCLRRVTAAGLVLLGPVPDLGPLYEVSRTFVAPTRFAAGIPLKVLGAAAHGVPVVTTSVVARQLGWRDGIELLVADDVPGFVDAILRLEQEPELWGELRAAALERVRVDWSPDRFEAALAGALDAARLRLAERRSDAR